MERIVTRRTYTKEVTEDVVEYKAKDGALFNTRQACENYERELEMKILNEIESCEELDDYFPFNRGEYTDWNSYSWYCPKSIEEIEKLRIVFPDATFKADDINHWICVEYNDCWSESIKLDDCISYVREILDALGYEMSVSPKTNE